MKILIIGSRGQLGRALVPVFEGFDVASADLDGDGWIMDIAQPDSVQAVFNAVRPDVVINTAAAHHVPSCELNPDWAFQLNAIAPRYLAQVCQASGARFIHISTDYVFGNRETRPYIETDLPEPLNVYGASKLAGEQLVAACCENHIIVRTAALYGHFPCRAKGGENFIEMMKRKAQTEKVLRVVDDEFTTPTYVNALARQIHVLTTQGEPGVYHATCRGECSWYQFAVLIFNLFGISVEVQPVSAESFPSPVRRPRYSVLANQQLHRQQLDIMPHWQDALAEYIEDQNPYGE